MASKRVWEWSQILIPSPGWPCMQNEAKSNWHFDSQSRKTWLFANNFKYRHIIYRWKTFLAMSMNSGSLPQKKKKGFVWLKFTDKVYRFCIENCADDPGTFIAYGGRHCDKEVKSNLLGPRIGGGAGQRWRCNAEKLQLGHARSTHCHRRESASTKLGTDLTTPSELPSLAHIRCWATDGSYHGLPLFMPRREKKGLRRTKWMSQGKGEMSWAGLDRANDEGFIENRRKK